MVKVKKHGQMETFMKGIFRMDRKMATEYPIGLRALYIRDSF